MEIVSIIFGLGAMLALFSVYQQKTRKGILLSKLCADVCRDMGENTVGGGIELGGRLAILSLCIPLIGELMGYARELMG